MYSPSTARIYICIEEFLGSSSINCEYLLFQNQYFHVFGLFILSFIRVYTHIYYVFSLFMCNIPNAWFKVSCFLFPLFFLVSFNIVCVHMCVWCLLHFWTIIRDKVLFWGLHAIIHNVNTHRQIHWNRCDSLRKEKNIRWKAGVCVCVCCWLSPQEKPN